MPIFRIASELRINAPFRFQRKLEQKSILPLFFVNSKNDERLVNFLFNDKLENIFALRQLIRKNL